MAYSHRFSMRSLKDILLSSLIGLLFVAVGCGESAVGRAVGVDSPESPMQVVPPTPSLRSPDASTPMTSLGQTATPSTEVVALPDVKVTKVPPPVAQPDKVSPTVEPIKEDVKGATNHFFFLTDQKFEHLIIEQLKKLYLSQLQFLLKLNLQNL